MNAIHLFKTVGVVPFILEIAMLVCLVYCVARLCGPRRYFNRHNVEGWIFLLSLLFFMNFFAFFPAYLAPESWRGTIFTMVVLVTIVSMICLAFVWGSTHRR